MTLFSHGLNYCNEHVCCLEKERTDGKLPLLFVKNPGRGVREEFGSDAV